MRFRLFSKSLLLNKYKKALKSSYNDFDINTISSFVKGLQNEDFSECKDGFELYNKVNDYFSDLGVRFEPTSYFPGQWSNQNVSEAITDEYGNIIVYSIDANELFDIWESKYNKIDLLKDWANTIVHEMTHRYQLNKYPNRDSTGQGESEYEYLTNNDEIAAHVKAGVVELLNLGYTKEQLLDRISDYDKFQSLMTETNQLFPYTDYLEEGDELHKTILKQMYYTLNNV